MKTNFETTNHLRQGYGGQEYTKYTKNLLACFVYFAVNSLLAATPQTAALDDIPGNRQILTNAVEYVESAVGRATNAAVIAANAYADAATPGNYAAVSNAAMNALSRAEAGFTKWTLASSDAPAGYYATMWVKWDGANLKWLLKDYPDDPILIKAVSGNEDDVEVVFPEVSADEYTITATRTRLPTMADIPTDNARLANGAGYVTASVTNGLASAVATLAQRTSALETQYAAITNLLDGLEAALRTINGGD